jgi:hypothetical protein
VALVIGGGLLAKERVLRVAPLRSTGHARARSHREARRHHRGPATRRNQ